jgi:2'-5' RNA ligase
MYKIAAFIKFNKKIENKILFQKRKVKKLFGDQTYLNHPVHLTLFTLKIKKISDLKFFYKKLESKKKTKSLTISLSSADIFVDDPLTSGHTIFYKIKKNKALNLIQIDHLKRINKKFTVLKNDLHLFKNLTLRKNYKDYGFPFVGKIWLPHITIASIKNIKSQHKFIRDFLKTKISLKCIIDEIKFYKVIKDKHTFLFKTKII